MTSAAIFDAGPLSWVKGEIDLALERVATGLQQFGGNTADLTQIKFCRTHLHQVRGALTIVGLDGVTQFTDTLEALLSDLENGRQPADGPRIALIGRAIASIRRYLDDLLAGDPNQPLRLLDLYRQIAAARGLPAPSASELFFPDLSSRPQLPQQVFAEDGPAQLKSARVRYQKGLLAFIKAPNTPIGALELKLAAQMAACADASPALRGFWWVASGFFAALGEKAIAADAETKALCTRIDQQLRQQADGSRAVPEKLMRDALFQVAIARSRSADILAIKEAYQLDALIPAPDTKTVSQAAQLEPFLKRLKEIASASEEAWNKFCTGSPQALQTFCDATAALDQGAERLGNTDFRRLVRAVGSTANWIHDDRSRHNDVVSLEMATGVLLIGNGVENFTRLGPDFVHQVDVMVARLHACIAGTAMPHDGEVPVLDEMTRRAQEKLLVTQVVKEIQSSLGQIEQTLDTFFREPEQKEPLAACHKPISQIVGALAILGHMEAVQQLQESARAITRFQAAEYQPDAKDFEQVARQLSALGFFVEALKAGVSDYHAFVASLEVKPSKVEAAAADLAIQAQEAEAAAAVDTVAQAEKDLALIFAPDLSRAAPDEAEAPLVLAAEVAPAVSAPTFASVEMAPEIDAELLEIFLEEGNEVIATIGEQIDLLRSRPSDADALTTLRRAFHTLKGSSRMVGLMTFGDVAWVIEQVHNLWLRQEKPVDAAFLELVDASHRVFSAWIGHLEGNGEPLPDTTELLALGEQLKGGETVVAPGRPTASPAPAALATADETAAVAEEAKEIVLESAPEISFNLDLPEIPSAEAFSEVAPAEPVAEDVFGTETPLSLNAETETDSTPFELAELADEAGRDVDTSEVIALESQQDFEIDFALGEPVLTESAAPVYDAPAVESSIELLADDSAPEPSPFDLEPSEEVGAELDVPSIELVSLIAPLTEQADASATAASVSIDFFAAEEPGLRLDEPTDHPVDSTPDSTVFVMPPTGEAPIDSLNFDLTETTPSPADQISAETIDIGEAAAFDEVVELAEPAELTELTELTEPEEVVAPAALPEADEPLEFAEPVSFIEPAESLESLEAVEQIEPVDLAETTDLPDPSADESAPEIDPARVSRTTTYLGDAAEPALPSGQRITVAPTLYQIFLEEAQVHIAALQRGFGELEINPTAPTPNEMLRAAHTIGSISGTVGFQSALELGHGIEAALLRRERAGNPASLEALETLRIAIAELESMLAAIERNEPLGNPGALLSQIGELYPCLAAETIEAAASNLSSLARQENESALADDEPLPEDQLDESLLPIFLEEAADLVGGINERLAMWSANPYDTDTIHALTRLLHTLKGSARMAGAMRLGALTHRLESSIESAHRAGGADPVLIAALQADFDDIAELSENLGKAPPTEEMSAVDTAAPEAARDSAPGAAAEIPLEEVSLDEAALDLCLEEPAATPSADETLDIQFDAIDLEQADETLAEVTLDEAAFAEAELSSIALAEPEALVAEEAEESIVFLPEGSGAIDLPVEPEALVIDLPADVLPADEQLFETLPELASPIDPSAGEEAAPPVEFDAAPLDSQNFSANATFDTIPLEAWPTPVAPVLVTPPHAEALPADHLDPDLLPIFLEEAVEIVRTVYEQLDAWQAAPGDGAATHGLARSLHTLKGSARMAGAMSLGALTHTLESRAEEAAKSGQASVALIEEMKHAFDAIAQIVERLQRGESLAEMTIELPDDTAMAPAASEAPSSAEAIPAAPEIGREPATAAPVAARPGATTAPSGPAAVVAPAAPASVAAAIAAQRKDGEAAKAMLRVPAGLIDNLVNDAGELSIARARIEGEMRSLKQSLLDLTENVIRLRRQLREIEIQAESQMQSRIAVSTDGAPDFDPLELDRFTRFQEVTRMMAESVNDVATVQLNLLKNLDEANAGLAAQARLNRELQQSLMSVRMVPFSSITERLYRIVRQTAKELGKRADLEVQGASIELDQNVINKMIGPLEHLLRNAISHGIELPGQRVEQGKDEMGDIRLALRQEGNEVIITMRDDGAGLNFSRIRDKAIAKGLMSADDPYDERKLTEMIFNSGFSTAEQVSQIAGRGVGMDVVMTEVTNLGGRIDVTSESGKGSVFRIYLPLTLAVTNAVIVRVGSRYYAIPAAMIDQVREIKEGPLTELREAGGAEWMGNYYPFHFLPKLLGEPNALPEARRMYWVLYLHSGLQRVAVQVDELQSTHEIVVKNIGPQLARVIGIAGATVMGDGRVILILNPVALAARAQVSAAAASTAAAVAEVQAASGGAPVEAVVAEPEKAIHLPTVLVVDDSLTVRKITSRLLAREGYQVMLAKDGQDALEQMVEVIPDVILSDIEMPRMDGFELARNIRNDARLVNIPVVMISSRTADKHRSHAAELGVKHFLGKPYQEEELLGLIAGFIAEQRAA